jgi:cell division protein FtsB
MWNSRKTVSLLIAAALIVSALAGTLVYYNGVVKVENAKKASQESKVLSQKAETVALASEVSNLKTELTNLTEDAANLTSATLVTSLETHEMTGSASSYMGGLVPTPVPFNYLWIDGSVTNEGRGYAVDAGLHVEAYGANGTLEANVTVPFTGTTFGSDNATDVYVSKTGGSSSLALEILDSGQTTDVSLNIFHEGVASAWTVTPVCLSYSLNVGPLQNMTLTSQVNYLENQIADINATIARLVPNLVASLSVKACPATTQYGVSYENSLFIVGSVTNTGEGVAYNAGLHVIGYTSGGVLELNMTVPLAGQSVSYYAANYTCPSELSTLNSGYGYDSWSSSNSASIGIAIYVQDFVTNYTVTPVWTNTL